EREPVVNSEIQAVTRRVQQVIKKRAIADDQEDEEVVEHQNDEPAEIGAIGKLLVTQFGDERMSAVELQAQVDGAARRAAQEKGAFGLRRDCEIEDEVAMRELARREYR